MIFRFSSDFNRKGTDDVMKWDAELCNFMQILLDSAYSFVSGRV